MNEALWAVSDKPGVMLEFLFEGSRRLLDREVSHPVSDRKLRLFAAACCRWSWDNVPRGLTSQVLDVAESMADGEAAPEDVSRIRRVVAQLRTPPLSSPLRHVLADDVGGSAVFIVDHFHHQMPAGHMATLLRDVVGNPWRPQEYPCCEGARRVEEVPGDATTLIGGECPKHGATWHFKRWRTPDVCSLALAAYKDRPNVSGLLDPSRLAVLADALEEAGCGPERCMTVYGSDSRWWCQDGAWNGGKCDRCGGTGWLPNPAVAHLRSPGPHVRGCWALDILLDRK